MRKEEFYGNFYIGVDLGKHVDPSVVSVIKKEDNGILKLIHCKVFELETSYAAVISYLKVLTDKFHVVHKICVDKTGVGDPIVEDMQKSGLPLVEGVTFSEPKKEEVATVLKQNMVDDTFKMPYDREIINELNLERFELTKAGKIRFSHPEGTHDDRFWSVALAVYAGRAEAFVKPSPIVSTGKVMKVK
jgi:phage FluMu gp28-like protein